MTTREKPDYLDAHKRHWQDAELLYKAGRLPNADLLYGHSAESGLMAMMIKNGLPLTSWGTPEDDYRVHANELWDLVKSWDQGRNNISLGINPFYQWRVSHRYFNQNSSQFEIAKVNFHKKGAQQIKAIVDTAERNGTLP